MGGVMSTVNCLLKGTVHDLLSKGKYEAIRELISKVNSREEIREIINLERAIIEREKKQCTGVGEGVAIAHGKTEYAGPPLVFLGISRKGIDYDAPDGKPVNLLFIITNHPAYQQEYIGVLSAIARLAGNEDFRRSLLSLKHTAEIENVLIQKLSHLYCL